MTPALIADTGGLLRALVGGEGQAGFAVALRSASLVIVPALVLTEVDWFLRRQRPALRRLMSEIFDPQSRFEFEGVTAADIGRAMEFDAKFSGIELGLVDGSIAAVAERRRVYRVLTTDRRDFSVIRVGARYNRPLTLLP